MTGRFLRVHRGMPLRPLRGHLPTLWGGKTYLWGGKISRLGSEACSPTWWGSTAAGGEGAAA